MESRDKGYTKFLAIVSFVHNSVVKFCVEID